MNMEGISENTLEKLLATGILSDYTDLYKLSEHKDVIVALEGFGEKSYEKMIESIEASRNTTLPRVLYALGIPGIGVANAKVICIHFEYNPEYIMNADTDELSEVEGIGEILAKGIVDYFSLEKNKKLFCDILKELRLEEVKVDRSNDMVNGKSFVITGSLNTYANRDELKAKIESLGGKVTGSVSAKCECLINNDVASTSSKNKKAKELGVRIISEEDFNREYLGM